MSDVVVSTTESVTTVSVVNDIVQIAITESPVTVTTSSAGVQGASYNQGDPIYVTVTNKTGSTLNIGDIVYTSGANGVHTQVSKAIATSDATSARTLGWVAETIANNANGLVIVEGYLDGVNTQGVTEGAQLYLSGTVAGSFQETKPQAPIHLVYVGVCSKASAGNGRVYVKVQNGYELDELHDVQIISKQNNDVLRYDSTTSLWKNVASTALSVGTAVYATTSGTAVSISGSITRSQVSDFTSGTVAYASTSGTSLTISGTITASQVSDYASGTVANISGTVTQSQVSGLSSTLAGYAALGSANTFTVGPQTINTGATANKGLVVQGVLNQTANLFELQTSTGATQVRVNQLGNTTLNGNITSNNNALFLPNTTATVPVVVRGAASQSADLQQWQDSSAGTLALINSAGRGAFPRISAGAASDLQYGTLSVLANNTATVPIVARGLSGQSANLQEWQNSGGTVLANITSGGVVRTTQTMQSSGLQNVGDGTTTMLFGNKSVQLGGGTVSIGAGIGVIGISNASSTPTSNPTGGGILYVDTGALKYRGTSGGPATIVNSDGTDPNVFTLSTASTTILGGVKVDGTTITINGSGVISGSSSYSLATASATTLGGIKIGSGLSIDGSGVVSTTGGSGGSGFTGAGTSVTGIAGVVTNNQSGVDVTSPNITITGSSANGLFSQYGQVSTSGNLYLTTGDASGSNASIGNLYIDTGAPTYDLDNGGASNGRVFIGDNNTSDVNIGSTTNGRGLGATSVAILNKSTSSTKTLNLGGNGATENINIGYQATTPTVKIGTASTASSIYNFGKNFVWQPNPSAIIAGSAITAAQLQTFILTTTSTSGSCALPVGSSMDSIQSAHTDVAFNWSLINTAASGSLAIATATGHSIVGNPSVIGLTSAQFRSRRTGSASWTTYRIS